MENAGCKMNLMTHTNRGRLTVDTGGDWRPYATDLPPGATPLGVVAVGDDTGALVRLELGGYVRINGNGVSSLNARKIQAALAAQADMGEKSGRGGVSG